MNLNKPKNWETVDIAKGGYAETSYEFFESIRDVPLLKAKRKELWYIGTINNGEKLKQENLFTDEKIAYKAFESVKKFQESELASRHRFKGASAEFLQEWLAELGSNPYIGNSVYRYDALKELQQAKAQEINNKNQGEVIMEDKLIAVVKYPYEKPQTIAIEKGLKPLQEIVGGMITGADLPNIEGVYGYANDEGLFIGMEPNIYRPEYEDALVGPLVFVGAGENGDDVSLTPEQVKQVTDYLEKNSASDINEFLYHIQTNFNYYQPKKISNENTYKKFINCDVKSFIEEIYRHYTSLPIDRDFQIIKNAYHSPNTKDKRILMLISPNGMRYLSEYKVFLKNSYDNKVLSATESQDTPLMYSINLTTTKNNVILGDIYELDLEQYKQEIKNSALPITDMNLIYATGNSKKVKYNFDWLSYVNDDNILSVEFLPADIEKWEELLQKAQADRQNGNYDICDITSLKEAFILNEAATKTTITSIGEKTCFFTLFHPKEDSIFGKSLNQLEQEGLSVKLDNYETVEHGYFLTNYVWDELYEVFKKQMPETFYGYALNVGDVLTFTMNDMSVAYYVDKNGLQEIPGLEYLKEEKSNDFQM